MNPSDRIARYLDRAASLLEEAYAEPDDRRRQHLIDMADRYNGLAAATAEHLTV